MIKKSLLVFVGLVVIITGLLSFIKFSSKDGKLNTEKNTNNDVNTYSENTTNTSGSNSTGMITTGTVITGELVNSGNQLIDLATGSLSKGITTGDDMLIKYIKTGDIGLCGKIEDTNLQGLCKKINIKKFPSKDANTVYSLLAFETKNSSLCDKVEDIKLQQICKSNVEGNYQLNNVLTKARELKDSSLCDKLLDEKVKKECINKYNYFISLDKLLQSASTKKDKNVCNGGSNEQMKKECVAIFESNVEYTKYLEDAIKNKDISICYKIAFPGRVEDCKREYATKVK